MGADTQDMINNLQMQQILPPQPSLFGIQAPQNPQAISALLQKLQSQQAVAQTGNTPGPYGYLHDAGQKAFASVGQGIGTALGGALNQVGQAGDAQAAAASGAPPPPANPAATAASAIQRATQTYQQLVAAGQPENVARQTASQMLVSAGIPGAADVLAKSVQQGLDDKFKQAETDKDTSQGNMDTAAIAQKQREADQNTWTTIKETPEYTIQQNKLGEIRSTKVSDKASLPQTPEESANADAIASKIANYDMQMSDAVGRGNVQQRQDMLGRVLKLNPDFDVKNYKQSQDALKAYGPSGVQGQMMVKTQNAMNHLDALKSYGDALNTGDTQKINQAQNTLSQAFGGIPITSYQAVAPIVANEVSGALVKGGGGVAERQERVNALGAQLSGPQRSGAIDGMRSLLGAQYQNNKNLYKQTTLRNDFEQRFPVAGGFPAPPGAPGTAAQQTSPAASSGWGTAQVVK